MGKLYKGNAREGEVRNPNGNPNITKVKNQSGPKTDLGKLKSSIMAGYIKGINSPLLNRFRFCNKCPLGAKVITRIINNKTVQVSIPSKCTLYKPEQDCVIDSRDHVKKLRRYFAIGEKLDTVALQESLTYQMLEDAEVSRETELLKDGRPGFYTKEFMELAKDNLEALNRQKFGDKSTNLNVNVDLSEAIIDAYKKRNNIEEDDEDDS